MLCQRGYYSIMQSLGWPPSAEEFLEIVTYNVDARRIRWCDWVAFWVRNLSNFLGHTFLLVPCSKTWLDIFVFRRPDIADGWGSSWRILTGPLRGLRLWLSI